MYVQKKNSNIIISGPLLLPLQSIAKYCTVHVHVHVHACERVMSLFVEMNTFDVLSCPHIIVPVNYLTPLCGWDNGDKYEFQ